MAELLDIAAPHPRFRSRPTPEGNAGRRLPGWFGRQFRPAALPLALLLLALSSLFLFGGDRAYFYRTGSHDWNSSQTLTFAENLSFRHNLLIFHYQSQNADGEVAYPEPYSRFPLGGYALVKLAILPFGDADFQAKIYAGRVLMLLLFSAAAVLAYHSLARITGSRWDALTATLLAFCSYYALYYADKISNEITIDLFATMLAFHGMAVFVQQGRFRQLLIKSCAALLLGWHAYAFLLPFIAFGIAVELIKSRSTNPAASTIAGRLKAGMMTLRRSRYLALGIVTLLFGIAILAFNFSNEYFALDRAVPFQELPSVQSAIIRIGGNEQFNRIPRIAERLQPQVFYPIQFYRIGISTLPYTFYPYEVAKFPLKIADPGNPAFVCGILALIVCLAGLAAIRRRPEKALLLATLTASGFCWAVPMRHNVISHEFESVFYIGIPLAAFALALLGLRRLSRGRLPLSSALALVVLVMFVFSVSDLAGVGQTRAELAVEAEQLAEYTAVRQLVNDNAAVYLPGSHIDYEHGGARWAAAYYLAGKTLIFTDDYATNKSSSPMDTPGRAAAIIYADGYGADKPVQPGDYLLLHTRKDSPALLTPEHRHLFLYDRVLYDHWQRTAAPKPPIIDDAWQVYHQYGRLTYVSPECANQDARFFLHLIPQNTIDLPIERRKYGYGNHDFAFPTEGVTLSDGTCVIERTLPDYDIIAIRTGQYTETGQIWEEEYLMPSR